MPAADLTDGKMPAFKLLALLGLGESNNEARRLVQGGGVTIGPDREKVDRPQPATVAVTDGPDRAVSAAADRAGAAHLTARPPVTATFLDWPTSPARLKPAADEVHVWAATLDRPADEVADLTRHPFPRRA